MRKRYYIIYKNTSNVRTVLLWSSFIKGVAMLQDDKLFIRIDSRLKARAKEIAEAEGLDLSKVVNAYLKRYVAAKRKEQ